VGWRSLIREKPDCSTVSIFGIALMFTLIVVAHVDIQNFAWSSSPADESSVFTVDGGATWGGLVDIQAFTLSNVPVSTVPLPAALPLFAGGLVGLLLLGWRRKKAAARAD